MASVDGNEAVMHVGGEKNFLYMKQCTMLKTLISTLKTEKDPRVDGITAEMLKKGNDMDAQNLC